MNNKQLYSFDGFLLDRGKMVLRRDDEIIHLKPKAVETLAALVRRRGEVATKDEMILEVWPDSFVEENSLSRNIHEIRKSLSEHVDKEFIETIPRRGYRFTSEVTVLDPEDDAPIDGAAGMPGDLPENSLSGERPPQKMVRWHFVAIVLLGALLVSSFSLWWNFSGAGELSSVPLNRRNIKSVAILPLASLDKAQESQILSLGLSNELIGKIAGFNRFVVRPLSAVRKYAGTDEDVIEIGKKLEVDAILVGTLQKSGEVLRINVRLWDVRDGAQIWSKSFEEVETDLFDLQEDVAVQVAENLVSDLSDSEKSTLRKRPTIDPDAYRLYIRGRYLWDKRSNNGLQESVKTYKQALDLDPSFALAYAGLADSYVVFNDYGLAPPEESFPKARSAAQKALEIDPDLVEPRTTLAYVLATYDWKYSEAEAEYRKAIELNPNYATAHQWYGEMLTAQGRFEEAEARLLKAKELDPLAPIIRSELGVVKYYAGRYDDSIADFKKLKAEFPEFATSYIFLARCYEQKGLYKEAVDEELGYWKLKEMNPARISRLRETYSLDGYKFYLELLASGLEIDAKVQYVPEYRLTHTYARLRNREKLMSWLQKGVVNRSANINKVFIDPSFTFVKNDPGFQQQLRKMNLIK